MSSLSLDCKADCLSNKQDNDHHHKTNSNSYDRISYSSILPVNLNRVFFLHYFGSYRVNFAQQ